MNKFLRSATTLLLGLWLYLLSGQAMAVVWYSYKSGNWNGAKVWTQDPSGTTLVPLGNTAFPGVNDEVVILPGVAITMHANNITVQKMTIDEAATLIVGGTTGHNFTEVYGRGRMEVSSVTLPAGDYLKTNGFSTAQGGTLAFRGDAAVLSGAHTFNNMEIRLSAAANTFTLGGNLTLNGTMTVHTGKLLVGQNDGDAYTLKVPGNFYVEQAGGFEVHKGKHIAELGGDLAIRAKVKLTSKQVPEYDKPVKPVAPKDPGGSASAEEQQKYQNALVAYNAAQAVYSTYHYVNLLFNNKLQNQQLRTEAETILEQLKVDKGIGEENILHLVASRPGIFELRGKSNAGDSGEGMPGDSPAMNLVSGVARIGRNISIPRFLSANSNCNIPVNATLWVDGGDVAFDGNAVIYGAVQISAGTLNVKGNEGVTLREQGRFQVDGGLATLTEFRTAVLGNIHIGSFVMNGGDLVILGTQVTYASFTLPHKTNTFRMSGGRIRIVQPGTSANAFGGWLVAADPANIRVTGGTVVMENPTDGEFVLSSTAPFYNLTLRRKGSSAARAPFVLRDLKYNIDKVDYGNTNQHLKVLNDLVLAGFQTDEAELKNSSSATRNTILVAAPDAVQANTRDVYVGRNFVMEGYAAYQACFTDVAGNYPFNDKTKQPLTRNTTVFFGDQDGLFSLDNTNKMANPYDLSLDKTGTLAIGNLRVEKAKGKSIRQQDETNSTPTDLTKNVPVLVEVNGAINVVSGIYNQGNYVIRLWGSVEVKDQLGVWVEGVTPSLAQVRFREDDVDVVLNTTDGAIFGNTRFNVGGGSGFKITSSVKILRLDYMNGKVNLGPHKLTIEDFWSNSLDELDPKKFSTGRLFYTNGSVSDGGLSIKIKSGTSKIVFPVGEVDKKKGSNNEDIDDIKYTPATIDFIGGTTTGGYITVIPVDAQLPTAKIGVEKMSYYWRIQPEGFATPPTVKYTFQGREEDADPIDNKDETHQDWVAGSVLASTPFTRSAEALITFAGPAKNRAWTALFDGSGSGFPLVRADYTAGAADAFTGAPTIYYNLAGGVADWRNHTKWSTVGHSGPAVASGVYPKAGDVVMLKNTANDNNNHYVTIGRVYKAKPNDPDPDPKEHEQEVAEVVFDSPLAGWPARLVMSTQNAKLKVGRISGNGEIGYEFNGSADMPTIQGDMGDFMENAANWIIFLPLNTGGEGTVADLPLGVTAYPSVRIHGNGKDASSIVVRFTKDVTINGSLRIDVSSTLLMNEGAEGNILVKGNLNVGPDAQGGILSFKKTGTPRTLTVNGNVNISAKEGTNASCIEDGDSLLTGTTIHRMVVGGNLVMDNRSQMRLENVALEVNGLADQSYKLAGGSTAKFLRMVVNKPADKTFSLNADMDLAGTSEGPVAEKQLVMTSGKLLMNHVGLDFTLNSGTNSSAHFKLPQGTGLEVRQGVVRITATGGSAGFELDAPLTISGGNALFHSSIENFIEYSASGNAALTVSAGHLLLGGQLRRGLGSTDGVLHYTQTGGKVLLAAAGQPTQTSRGILDFANTSTFTLSGDANTLLLVGNRHHATPDLGTIFIGQDVVTTFSGDSRIQLGYNGEITIPGVTTIAATPVGRIFHVNAVPVLHNLTQRASTDTDHTLVLLGNDLRISGKLEIQDKAKLDANGRDMYISGTWLQNGTFDHKDGHVYFEKTAPKLQRSNTAAYDLNFYKLTAKPTGLFTLGTAGSSSLQVKVNDVLSIEGPTKVEEGKPLWALNNLRIGAEVSGMQGLKLSSDQVSGSVVTSSLQRILPLTESLKVSRLDADNHSGIRMERFESKEVDLLVTDKFELTKSTFDVGDNRLSLGENVVKIDGDAFGPDHQILVSGVVSSWGVRKYYPAGSSSFAYPIGLPGKNGAANKYRPVTLAVSKNTLATGQQAGVLIRLVDEQHPNTLATDLKQNVLHFYWRVESNQLPADFEGTLVAKYEDADILKRDYYAGCDIENYYGSAVLDEDGVWRKQVVTAVCPTPSLNAGVNPVANTITYTVRPDATRRHITGDYTAGDTYGQNNDLSIPDRVRIYRTDAATATWSAGPWKYSDDGSTWSAQVTETPLLGSKLVIQPGHKFELDRLDVRVFSTEIQSDNATKVGELLVPNNSDGHNLGRVSGTGRIKLVSNTSSIKFPAGVFENFLTLTGGEVEYAGPGDYNLSPRTTRVRGLHISGGGTKTLVQAVEVGAVGLDITGNTALGVQDISADKAPAITVNGPIDIVHGTLDVGRGILTATGATTLTQGALKLSALNAYLDGLAINGGELLLGSPDGMSFLTLTGNLSRSGTGKVNSTQCDPAFAKRLVLKGSSQQRITGEFADAKQCAICELELNNARGAQVNVDGSSKVEIRQKLVLTRGVLNTTYARGTTDSYQFADLYTTPDNNANEIKKLITPLLLQEAAQVEGGSASAYVRGWMGKVLAYGAQVTLPLGDAGRHKPTTIQSGTTAKRIWRGVYYAIAPDKTDFKARLLASEFANDPTAHVSASEYWVIGDREEKDASSYYKDGKADITLPWDASSGKIEHPGDMRIVKSNPDRVSNNVNRPDWKLAAASQTPTAGDKGTGTVQAAGVEFSTHAFTFASIRRSADANVLPVELLSFQAKPLQAQVDLRWELANAHKLDRVEVQRSADGVSFRTEQTVYATGEGRLSQQWMDAQPLAKAYYRLMLLEQDGKYQYSVPLRVQQASYSQKQALLYPNPTAAGQQPTLVASGLPAQARLQLALYTTAGVQVWQGQQWTDAAGNLQQVLLLPAHLPTGLYWLRLHSSQGVQTLRWLKQ